jgi:hypothetical protein
MKKIKIYRVLGVALTVMMLAGLMFGMATPTGAATTGNKWVKFPTPVYGVDGDWFMDHSINVRGPMDIAKDGTLYAYAELGNEDVIYNIMKSTNGGRTWSKTDYFRKQQNDVAVVEIVCSTSDASIVYVTDGSLVYWTDNAGKTFEVLSSPPVGSETIKCMDVGYISSKPYIFIGTLGDSSPVTGDDDVWVCEQAVYGMPWSQLDITDNRVGDSYWAVDIYDVKLSPKFGTDQMVTAVVSLPFLNGTYETPLAMTADSDYSFYLPGGTGSPGGTHDHNDAITIRALSGGDTGILSVSSTDVTVTGTFTSFNTTSGVYDLAGGQTLIVTNTDNTGTTFTQSGTVVTDDGNIEVEISNDGLGDVLFGQTFVTTRYSGAEWAATTPDVELMYDSSPYRISFCIPHYGVTVWDVIKADATIWQPDDFDSDPDSGKMEYFVGVNDGLRGGGDIYWILAGTTFYDQGAGDVFDLHGAGNVGAANMVAGAKVSADSTTTPADNADVKRSTDGSGASWSSATKKPTGKGSSGPVFVRAAKDFATSKKCWALTNGDDGAMSYSVDQGKLFNQISLMDVGIGTILDIEPTPDGKVVFMVTRSGEYNLPNYEGTSLWKYDSATKFWERIWHNSLMLKDDNTNYISDVETSPGWATDTTVLFADRGNNRAYYATDGGGDFKRVASQPVEPADEDTTNWLVIDKTTRLVSGEDGNIYKTVNNGTSWKLYEAGNDTIQMFALDPNNKKNVLAGNDNSEVYLSTDAGETWKEQPLGEQVDDNNAITFVAFDAKFATNKTIYATTYNNYGVYRLVIGTDDSWQQISDVPNTWPEVDRGVASSDPEAGYNLAVANDGTLYTVDWDYVPVARCVNPTAELIPANNAPFFETLDVNGVYWKGDYAWGLWITPGASNVLWTIVDTNFSGSTWDQIWTYNDQVTTPVLTTPANGTTSYREDSVTLKWNAVPNATLYHIYFARDPDFNTYDDYDSIGTSILISALEDGTTYYWKVAVNAEEPCISPGALETIAGWSTTFKFDTALSVSQWNPFVGGVPEAPYNGATNVPLTPSFAWNAADWATGYEFILADNAAFTTPIVSKTGANALTVTVYTSETKLTNSKTYYWKVRAIKGSTDWSEWATGVFTTEAAAPAPPAPPPPVPTVTVQTPAPLPTTPMYIWVIIGVGAALVLAVIVLIVRTRRVA